ncbi:hypothetical protein H8S45_12170 [Agathobaculum sp. NSJ-28]|uniref:Uncharacterized protein n=1 Tax=Agathobaculum faecis TaxID=2763013 RepID=A0A923RWP2_9FIRM|nr:MULTISPECIES: hypothetical protein [Agathobaculum]MBC5726208.1 hypothetical protein [Agathobaculum faecis]
MLHQLREKEKGGMNVKSQYGIHTFSIMAKSSYHEIQELWEENCCQVMNRDPYFLNTTLQITEYKERGVEIVLNQSLTHPSWITVIVNPSSLLAGKYCPTALFIGEKTQINAVSKVLQKTLAKIGIEQKKFILSRVDLTCNQYYESKRELLNQLYIWKKTRLPSRYEVSPFGKGKGSAKQYREVNEHAWTIESKSCAFSVYDKTYELKKRHKMQIAEQILRLELRLKRKRIHRLTDAKTWEKQLQVLAKRHNELFCKFLHRLYQDFPEAVTMQQAEQWIEASGFQKKAKNTMRKLIKTTRRCKSLTAAQKKLELSNQAMARLYKKFQKLKLNPIVLPENGKHH